MPGETPTSVPKSIIRSEGGIPNTFTIEGVKQLAGRLKEMSPDRQGILYERASSILSTAEDRQLAIELSVLCRRILILDTLRVYQIPQSEEEIEIEVAQYRKELEQRFTLTGPAPIPVNKAVFEGELLPTQEASETEQSKFLAFLTKRNQTGMIQFQENGKPTVKAMNDAIMLYYRWEEAIQRGITKTPEDVPSEPLTQAQTIYLNQL